MHGRHESLIRRLSDNIFVPIYLLSQARSVIRMGHRVPQENYGYTEGIRMVTEWPGFLLEVNLRMKRRKGRDRGGARSRRTMIMGTSSIDEPRALQLQSHERSVAPSRVERVELG